MPVFKSFCAAVVLCCLGGVAWAECACFCVEGQARTLCTTVTEAQQDPTLCRADQAACPAPDAAAAATGYEAPAEGATNCRDMQVWDPAQNDYVSVKACDVLSAG
jgi:hypothetical protein